MEQRLGLLHDAESEQDYLSDPGDCTIDNESSPRQGDIEKLDGDTHLISTRKWQYRGIGGGLAILFAVFSIGLVLNLRDTHGVSSTQFVNMGECGRTPQEARDNKCVFDLMMSGWVHPPCYDQELSDEFLRVNNFTFYREREGINILTEAEARQGNYEVIYSHGTFHYQHCAYIWAKQIRANKKSPLVLDSVSRSKEHVEHCYKRVGNPNITMLPLATGTKIKRSAFRLKCMIGEMEVP